MYSHFISTFAFLSAVRSDVVGSDVVGSAEVGSEVMSSAGVGFEVVGSAEVGSEVVGSAGVGSEVVGSAEVGSEVEFGLWMLILMLSMSSTDGPRSRRASLNCSSSENTASSAMLSRSRSWSWRPAWSWVGECYSGVTHTVNAAILKLGRAGAVGWLQFVEHPDVFQLHIPGPNPKPGTGGLPPISGIGRRGGWPVMTAGCHQGGLPHLRHLSPRAGHEPVSL